MIPMNLIHNNLLNNQNVLLTPLEILKNEFKTAKKDDQILTLEDLNLKSTAKNQIVDESNPIQIENRSEQTQLSNKDISYKIMNEMVNFQPWLTWENSQNKQKNLITSNINTNTNITSNNSTNTSNRQNNNSISSLRQPLMSINNIDTANENYQNYQDINTLNQEITKLYQTIELKQTDINKLKQNLDQQKQTKGLNVMEQLIFLEKFKMKNFGQEHLKEIIEVRKNNIVKLNEDIINLQNIKDQTNQLIQQGTKEIEAEFQPGIQTIDSALIEINILKQEVNQHLIKENEKFNQILEQRAMTKEDLNGKLMQRAELVAHREELEQIYEDLKSKYTQEVTYLIDQNNLKKKIQNLTKKSNDLLIEKKQQIQLQEKYGEEIFILNDKLNQIQNQLKCYQIEKDNQLKNLNYQIACIEDKLNDAAKSLGFPELDNLFNDISEIQGNYLEKEILKKQLFFIDEEEDKINETYFNKSRILENQLLQEELNNNDQTIFLVQKEIGSHKIKHQERIQAIQKWKQEIIDQINLENNNTQHFQNDIENDNDNTKDVFNIQQIIDYIEKQAKIKNLEQDQINFLIQFIQQYIQMISVQEKTILEKIKDEQNQELIINNLDQQIERCKVEKIRIDDKIKEIDFHYTQEIQNIKNLEHELNDKKILLNHNQMQLAEKAFNDYLDNQQNTFDQLSKTYGFKAVQQIKLEHHKQFIEIMKFNQKKRLEKFKQLQMQMDSINQLIQCNIKSVEMDLINIAENNSKQLQDIKEKIMGYQKDQQAINQKESEFKCQLKILQDTEVQKIEELVERLHKKESKILNIDQKIDELKNQVAEQELEVNIINIQLNNTIQGEDNKITDIQKMKHIQNDQILEEQIHQSEIELKLLKKQLDNLEMQKLSLEQNIIEINYNLNAIKNETLQVQTNICNDQEKLLLNNQNSSKNKENEDILQKPYKKYQDIHKTQSQKLEQNTYVEIQKRHRNFYKSKPSSNTLDLTNISSKSSKHRKNTSWNGSNNSSFNDDEKIIKSKQSNLQQPQQCDLLPPKYHKSSVSNIQQYFNNNDQIKQIQTLHNSFDNSNNNSQLIYGYSNKTYDNQTYNQQNIMKQNFQSSQINSKHNSDRVQIQIDNNSLNDQFDNIESQYLKSEHNKYDKMNENNQITHINEIVIEQQENSLKKEQITSLTQNKESLLQELKIQFFDSQIPQNINDNAISSKNLCNTLKTITEEQMSTNRNITQRNYLNQNYLNEIKEISIDQAEEKKDDIFQHSLNKLFLNTNRNNSQNNSLNKLDKDFNQQKLFNKNLKEDILIQRQPGLKFIINQILQQRKNQHQQNNDQCNKLNKLSNNQNKARMNSTLQNYFSENYNVNNASSAQRAQSEENAINNIKKLNQESYYFQKTQNSEHALNNNSKIYENSKNNQSTMPSNNQLKYQENQKQKRQFKLNIDSLSIKEIQFFEQIQPLLEGSQIFKKFSSYQSLRQPVFNPLLVDCSSPENCGYGIRTIQLNKNLQKIEFKQHLKPGLEMCISIDSIIRPIVPSTTKELIKYQKHFNWNDYDQTNQQFKQCIFQGKSFQQQTNMEQILSCQYYAFCIVLDKGRLELIAPSYAIFQEWINGINQLIKFKKLLGKLQNRIEYNNI